MAVRTIRRGGKVHFAKRITKADTALIVKDVLTQEDDFATFYTESTNSSTVIVQPPFTPKTLVDLVTRNNILSQCITAMEVNIDGTGFSIEKKKEDGPDNKKEQQRLASFFDEPYPETSFVTLRRNLRFDLESTGNAYLEVIKNAADEVVFLRHLDSTLMRLIKLDGAVEVEKEVERDGKVYKAKMQVRERRFVQLVGTQLIYFKEFGASRKLHRKTGFWETEQTQIPIEEMASEVIHFTLERHAETAYGLPRWINQLPSVMGSRKAEEFNLEFFDSGGIPPAVVFLQGGGLVDDVKEQLMAFLSGKATHRVAVVEVQSTSGTIDSAGSVQVRTERFGDSSKDAMFQAYDKSTEEHVRVGFRLPPLFIGRAQDYNFATAVTAYMVTEAQVFQPERHEFDEIINKKVLKALGAKDSRIVSKPVTLKNVEVQLQAIGIVKDKVKGEKLIETINDISGLNLEFDVETSSYHDKIANPSAWAEGQVFGPKPKPEPKPQPQVVQQIGGKKPIPKQGAVGGRGKVVPLRKEEGDEDEYEGLTPEAVVGLVNDWAVAIGIDPSRSVTPEEKELIHKAVADLSPEQRTFFDKVLATKSFVSLGVDPAGLEEIASCCTDVMAKTP